jgi:hypothetical protein
MIVFIAYDVQQKRTREDLHKSADGLSLHVSAAVDTRNVSDEQFKVRDDPERDVHAVGWRNVSMNQRMSIRRHEVQPR